MARTMGVVLLALLGSTPLMPVECQTETETTTTESSTITSTDTTSSQTSTTVPGPFFVTQSIVLFSNGTQEEVESFVLGALEFVFAETARQLDVEFVPEGPQLQPPCTEDAECPNGDDCSPHLGICLPRYELLTSGRCTIHVRTMHECSSAATVLGLADTSALPDYQEGVSFDPPFCYFEGVSLKYNRNGANTGGCRSTDRCLCATSSQNISYGNLTAVTTAIELRSSGGDGIAELLGDARDDLPDTNLLDLLNELGIGQRREGGRRLSSRDSGTFWRVDAEVTADDRFTSEQLFVMFSNLNNPRTTDHANFMDAIQVLTANSSLLVADFLFSTPAMSRPTETTTTTETQTTTSSSTSTTETTVSTSATAADTTAVATSMAADAGQPAPLVEDSTALIMGVAGGAAVLLTGAIAAVIVFKRRGKAGNVMQDNNEQPQDNNERDVERAATSNSRYSDNVVEI